MKKNKKIKLFIVLLFLVSNFLNTVNAKENGKVTYFYENGSIRGEANFIQGKKEGIAKTYFEDGKVSGEINYIKGKQNGTT